MANSDSSTMQRARRRHLPCTKMVRVLICSIALLVPTLALALVTAQPAPVGSPTTSGAAPGGAGGAGGSSAGGNSSTPIDCAKIFPSNRNESFMAHGPEVDECMHRAADAPVQLRPNNGEGPGVRIGGAGGFSYGTVQAPESPPGEQKANASIGRDKILAACNFPPRVKIGVPPKVSIPSGTCLDFLNGVFKDKDGLTNSAPAPAGITPAAAACPAESDTSGAYGTKVAITGSSIATPCGGLVPTSTSDQSLSVNASHLATTVNNAYFIWVYQKSGNQFALKGNSLKLPSYLCRKDKLGIAQKTVDLTAPMEQMITYNPSARTIAIRLRSRATMNLAFIPEFDPSQPEKYLVLPLNAAGDPVLRGDCAAGVARRRAGHHRAPGPDHRKHGGRAHRRAPA